MLYRVETRSPEAKSQRPIFLGSKRGRHPTSNYRTGVKAAFRRRLARRAAKGRGLVVYLEAREALATDAFLWAGVEPWRLRPVTHDLAEAAGIAARFPDLRITVASLGEALRSFEGHPIRLIWADYLSTVWQPEVLEEIAHGVKLLGGSLPSRGVGHIAITVAHPRRINRGRVRALIIDRKLDALVTPPRSATCSLPSTPDFVGTIAGRAAAANGCYVTEAVVERYCSAGNKGFTMVNTLLEIRKLA